MPRVGGPDSRFTPAPPVRGKELAERGVPNTPAVKIDGRLATRSFAIPDDRLEDIEKHIEAKIVPELPAKLAEKPIS
ncbi:hypothetical protein FACS189425_01810 [Clostridia bacterium]|nr:hypothetical protein FACS189425_01810 [Clostridia bacterium]